MPYRTEYAAAEVFFEHNGVKIYHVYRDNDVDQSAREYWFDNKEDSDDDEGFDVRDFAAKLKIPMLDTKEWKEEVFRKAIEAGLITSES